MGKHALKQTLSEDFCTDYVRRMRLLAKQPEPSWLMPLRLTYYSFMAGFIVACCVGPWGA